MIGAVYLTNLKYRDQIIQLLKNYIDEYIQTEIHIKKENIHLQVIKKFPYASLELNDILIKSASGPNYHFITCAGKDTLLYARKVSLVFNIMSLFTKNYELSRIDIDNAMLNILIDSNGRNNYSIFRTSNQANNQTSYTIDLHKIILSQVFTRYIDYGSNTDFGGLIKDATISGVFSGENFMLQLQMRSNHCHFGIQTKNYLLDQEVDFETAIEKKTGDYNFSDSKMNIAGLKFQAFGKWAPGKKYYNFSVLCKSFPFSDLNQKLSSFFNQKSNYIPDKGSLSLEAKISGIVGSQENPHLNVRFELRNGLSSYFGLEKIFVDGSFTNGNYNNNASSRLIIDSLSAASGISKLYCKGKLDNFNTPEVSINMEGVLELGRLSAIQSVKKRFELSGISNISISVYGTLPSFTIHKSADISGLKIKATANFKDISIKSAIGSFPAISTSGEIMVNDLKTINLENISINSGKSNFKVTGTITNIPYFHDNTLSVPVYRCNVLSPELHIEDLLINTPTKMKPEGTSETIFPDSVIVYASLNTDKLYFGKFEASNVKCFFQYQPKVLLINGLSMKSQDGVINCDLNISPENGLFIVKSDANIQNADIKNLFYSFNNFGQNVIGSENMAGRLSGIVHVTAAWDQYLHPVLDRLNLQSDIVIDKGEIINYEPLMGLSKFIRVDELKHIYFDQLVTTINIQQEIVYISKTDIRSSAISLVGSGEHHFDNTYLYRLQVQLSDVLWNKAKKQKPENTEFGYVVDDGLGRTTLPLKIKGKNAKFEVSYDLHTAGSLFFDKFRKEKKEAHRLFDQSDSLNNNQGFQHSDSLQQIYWNEENTEKSKHSKEKNQNKKEEFTIEWKDE